ncbi:MAG TPA: hypothetical protein VJ063_17765 [Verrucomicrobiae bacterium]|nr:hypothetical protein [Verrucomicrobiae bacterium]
MREMREKALAFKAISGGVAALWLMVAVVGASPQLHRALHEDSTAPDHSCVIERISQGSLLFSPAPPVVISVYRAIVASFEFDFIILPSRDDRIAPSRGPPALPTFRTVAG